MRVVVSAYPDGRCSEVTISTKASLCQGTTSKKPLGLLSTAASFDECMQAANDDGRILHLISVHVFVIQVIKRFINN